MKRFPLFVFLLFTPFFLLAATYEYTLSWESPHTRTYQISLSTETQTSVYTDFELPAWRPGRYILQDFAAAVSNFSASNSSGKPLLWKRLDKDTWRVFHEGPGELRISYHYYADNPDAGSSFLGEGQAYFNPVNLFMYVPGRLEDPVTLEIPSLPKEWKAATALTNDGVYNRYKAASYHEFADSPTVFSKDLKTLTFTDQGVRFYIHFQGNYLGNREVDEAVVENVKKICQTQARIFGGYPFPYYHFIFRLLPYSSGHAVEHSRSASFIRHDRATASVGAIRSINGVVAHEFWHAWNVKRIRPAALWPYDYATPPYTTLHWFTEGVTDYMADLTLVRADLIPRDRFLREMAGNISRVENSYAAQVVSPSESSFESWLSGSSYAHPFRSVSYYTLGARMGMVLDLSLRNASDGKVGLDDLFQYLYLNYFQKNLGVPEEGIRLAAEALTGKSWGEFFARYIDGTEQVDYESLLAPFGLKLEVEQEDQSGTDRLGILAFEEINGNLLIRAIHPYGDAYRDGLTVNDLILEIDGQDAASLDVDAYVNQLKKGEELHCKVYRDFQVVEVTVRFQGAYLPLHYELQEMSRPGKEAETRLLDWLGGK